MSLDSLKNPLSLSQERRFHTSMICVEGRVAENEDDLLPNVAETVTGMQFSANDVEPNSIYGDQDASDVVFTVRGSLFVAPGVVLPHEFWEIGTFGSVSRNSVCTNARLPAELQAGNLDLAIYGLNPFMDHPEWPTHQTHFQLTSRLTGRRATTSLEETSVSNDVRVEYDDLPVTDVTRGRLMYVLTATVCIRSDRMIVDEKDPDIFYVVRQDLASGALRHLA